MKAIVLKPGTTQIQVTDFPDPIIQKETQIKVKIIAVGICGTDREEAIGGRADAPQGEDRLVIGHEMLGSVVEIGSKVSKVKVKDRVVISVRRGCNACEPCLASRSDYCTTGNYKERGIKGAHGFQSTYVVDDESYAIKVPDELGDIAVMAEPMAVVQKAIQEAILLQSCRMNWIQNPNWSQGKVACVAGLGPIGLLACAVLRLKGAHVIGLDRAPPDGIRAKLLKAMGGTFVNDKNFDMDAFRNKYPDLQLIVDAAGVAQFDFNLIELLGPNGILVLTGVPAEKPQFPVNGSKLMRQIVLKNQIILGSVNESIQHFIDGLHDMQEIKKKWPGVLEQFITHQFHYTEFQKVFEKHGSEEIKAIIRWDK